MLPQIAGAIRGVEQLFRDEWTTSADVYLPVPSRARCRNRTLAATYRRVVEEAEARATTARADRGGARRLVPRLRRRGDDRFQAREWLDSSGERHAGCSRGTTCATGRRRYEEPVGVDYHGLTVLKAGPWSQGPVFLQQLRLLEGFDLAAIGHAPRVRPHGHRVREARVRRSRGVVRRSRVRRRAARRRCSRARYADERRGLVGEEASAELRPGSPGGREPRLPRRRSGAPVAPGVGEPTRGDTVHLDVVDRFGNMVSATPSGGWLWGSPVDPGARLLPRHARADVLARGGPAELARAGQAPADDALADARRCATASRTSRSARPAATSRTSGRCNVSSATSTSGSNLQAAIDAPNHHTEAFPSFYPRGTRPRHVAVEERVGEETIEGLRERGHDVEVRAVVARPRERRRPRARRVLKAGANPRGAQGYAAGR